MDPIVIGLGAFGVVMIFLLVMKTLAAMEWEEASKTWQARAFEQQADKEKWRELAKTAQLTVDALKTPRTEGKYGRGAGIVQAHEALSNTETLRKMGLIDQKKSPPTAPVVKHGGRGASPEVVPMPVPVSDDTWTAPDVASPSYSTSDDSPSYSSDCGSSSYSDSSSSSSDCGSSSSSSD